MANKKKSFFSFFMICPATQQTRASFWLRRHLPEDGSVQVRDVTSMYSGINLIGPHAQQLLGDVSDISTDRSDFKAMTYKVRIYINRCLHVKCTLT